MFRGYPQWLINVCIFCSFVGLAVVGVGGVWLGYRLVRAVILGWGL